MNPTSIFLLLLAMLPSVCHAQAKLAFSSYREVLAYADRNSLSLTNDRLQGTVARHRTLSARLAMFNPKAPASLELTDHTKRTVNFIPAEVFGGPQGTFRPVTFGQQYTSNVIIEPQLDLLNPQAMAQIRVAKANEQLTAVNSLINTKAVYEAITATYYSILSCQWQVAITTKSLAGADSLLRVVQDKQKEGVARSQDVNTALTSRLAIAGKLQQLQAQQEQQYNKLRILCDIDGQTPIEITGDESGHMIGVEPVKADGNLLQRQGEWQTKFRQATLSADKRWAYPTLTLFASMGWQESNDNSFFHTNNWLGSSYVGLRLSIPLLPEVSKITAVRVGRANLEMAANDWAHAKLQEQINNSQLELDYKKAIESHQIAAQVEALSNDSYQKNLNIYREGLISATDLIISFEQWLNSGLNTAALLATAGYAKSRIIINNTLK